ncbi:MAG: alpha/beta fold hydrolase, partial [Thermotogota bacterium]
LLIDPAPADGLVTPEEYYPILDSYKHNRGLLKQALEGMLASGDPDKMLGKLTDDALLMDERAFSGNARALEKYNYLEELSKLKAPVLFLVGENDSLITESLLKPTIEQLERANIEVLDNTGHAINIEAPERFVQILTNFFGGKRK